MLRLRREELDSFKALGGPQRLLGELAVILAGLEELLEVLDSKYVFDCLGPVGCVPVIGLAYLVPDVVTQVGRSVFGFVALVQPAASVLVIHLLFELEPELSLIRVAVGAQVIVYALANDQFADEISASLLDCLGQQGPV